ncbi:MAG TPA: HEPN domain-containing protein [Flavisolibacter sp.]|jgi:HEPN domain-containing protein|nr:HEPN domain-containing protein [Flavisolibacter sp.]
MYHQCGQVTHKVYNTNIFVYGNGEDQEWQEWQERLRTIISQVPDKPDHLKPVVQFLVATLAPSQVYCLNHPSANGKNEDPWIHLCLIIPNRCTTPFTELEPVLEMAVINHRKLSCSLHQEGNTRDALKKGHLFYTLAFRAENRIYDSGETVLPQVSPEAWQAVKNSLHITFGYYHNKASRFYEAAALLLLQQDPLALFMLQQAAEMIFRGMLLGLNGYDKKTHELRCLKKHLRRCAPRLLDIFPDDTAEEQRLLTLLEEAYLQARYQPDYTFQDKDAALLQQRVKCLLDTAVQVKEQVVQSLGDPVVPGVCD